MHASVCAALPLATFLCLLNLRLRKQCIKAMTVFHKTAIAPEDWFPNDVAK